MQFWQNQMREGMNPRTYLLAGILLMVLVWIHSLDEKTRSLRSRSVGGSGATPVVSIAAGAVPARPGGVAPTPAGWGEDPFQRRFRLVGEPAASTRSGDGAATRGTGLYLQGVMNGPMGRTALVNGEVVREGDRFAGREVLQIGVRSVLILDHGTVVTLTLKGDGS